MSSSAVLLPGKSTDPNFDLYQLQSPQVVRENAFSGRLDMRFSDRWSSYLRVFHDQGKSDLPNNIAGQIIRTKADPTNAVFNLQGLLSEKTINEFKFGYNGAPTRIGSVLPGVPGLDLAATTVSLQGSVANTGIAGQGASSGLVTVGGLVRANSAQNGRGQPYDPYSLSIVDAVSSVRGSHFLKFGGELCAIRMQTDRLGGTTYTYQNLNAFLANTPSSIQYLGDMSAPSVFNNGATGPRNLRQPYYVGFAQDEWRVNPNVTLNYGGRYEYYTVMREANDLQVKFNIDTGKIDANTTPAYKSNANSFQPRVGVTYTATSKTVLKAGFGMFVGPGQTEDLVQPSADSDRISTTISSGAALAYPLDPNVAVANFTSNPNNRSYQPRAYANEYTVPERIWQYTGSVQQDLNKSMVATVSYVGSQGRNLFLRSVANQITGVYTNPNPTKAAIVVREFSLVTARDANGNPTAVQNPFAEIDYKTSGGRDSYNALQLGLSRRSTSGLTMDVSYALSRSFGNTSGSNEALTAANNARTLSAFDYDLWYNNFDVRHNFTFSALYALPYGSGRRTNATGVADAILGGWDIGGIINARSGLPIDLRVTRLDVVYADGAGNIFNNPAAGRSVVINTPGGGASRGVRRPDLVPGVDPYIVDGGVLYLNPLAFATPKSGTFGNLQRGSLKGPGFFQVDLVAAKHFGIGSTGRNVEFRAEVFNLFDQANFSNPVTTLPNALPNSALSESNKVQPGQAFTSGAAARSAGSPARWAARSGWVPAVRCSLRFVSCDVLDTGICHTPQRMSRVALFRGTRAPAVRRGARSHVRRPGVTQWGFNSLERLDRERLAMGSTASAACGLLWPRSPYTYPKKAMATSAAPITTPTMPATIGSEPSTRGTGQSMDPSSRLIGAPLCFPHDFRRDS